MADGLLNIPINSKNFPAKLWRLVNSPYPQPVYWDTSGEVVVIDQEPFQKLFLSRIKCPDMNHSRRRIFKTTNFASFVRQLNMYGFRKISKALSTNGSSAARKDQIQHHYHNPNFKKNHPDLLVNLKRLSISNKTKGAGLGVKRRSKQTKNRGRSDFVRQTPKPSSHPYPQNGSRPTEDSNWARLAAHNWVMGHSDASSPSVLYTDNSSPAAPSHSAPGEASSTIPPYSQQASQGFVNPGQILSSFIFSHVQYVPGYYSPVCQYSHQSSLSSDMTGGDTTTHSFSPFGCYKPTCPVSFVCPLSQSPHLQKTASPPLDEMQRCPELCTVRVFSPMKLLPLSEGDGSVQKPTLPISSHPSGPSSCSSEPAETDANPPTSVIIAASERILQGKPFTGDGATVKKEQRKVSPQDSLEAWRWQEDGDLIHSRVDKKSLKKEPQLCVSYP